MATVSTKDGNFALLLSVDEFNQLGLDPNKEYEIVKAKDGVWVITDKPAQPKESSISELGLDAQIFEMLEGKSYRDRVEGKFEKTLNNEEFKRFRELLQSGQILKYRRSKEYIKAIYIMRREFEDELKKHGGKAYEKVVTPVIRQQLAKNSSTNTATATMTVSSALKDGYMIIRDEQRAKQIGYELTAEIKSGQIKGLKYFDGQFYLIDSAIFTTLAPQLLMALQNKKSATVAEISGAVHRNPELVKAACVFLAEEGVISEKKKDLYQFID